MHLGSILDSATLLCMDCNLVSTPKEVSIPSLLNDSLSENLQNIKTSDKSPIAKIEEYTGQ